MRSGECRVRNDNPRSEGKEYETNYRACVVECASPLALLEWNGNRKRQRTGAVQNCRQPDDSGVVQPRHQQSTIIYELDFPLFLAENLFYGG